jgi:hypothetical protein
MTVSSLVPVSNTSLQWMADAPWTRGVRRVSV